MKEILVGDIVQIVDDTDAWWPCLLIVTEVKSWGLQAACLIPESNAEQKIARAFRRLEWAKIQRVGKAEVVPG